MKTFRNRVDPEFIPLYICEMEKMPEWYQDNFQYDLEEKIWPLVRVLNLKGIPTLASCEGDSKISYSFYNYPWVGIQPTVESEKMFELNSTIKDFNYIQKIQWTIKEIRHGGGVYLAAYHLLPNTNAPLLELQNNVLVFSDYIRNNMKDL